MALELLEPPIALFIAAIPFIKMLNGPKAPLPARVISQVLDGAAKPVGGDADHTIQLTTPDVPVEPLVSRSPRRRGASRKASAAS